VRPVVAVLGGAWGLLNLAVAILFVANAFVAKTAIKEGLPAQAALLLGGILIGLFAVLVLWECYRLMTRATAEAS
jgi:hypothetical protein